MKINGPIELLYGSDNNAAVGYVLCRGNIAGKLWDCIRTRTWHLRNRRKLRRDCKPPKNLVI